MNKSEIKAIGLDWDNFLFVSPEIKAVPHIEAARNFGVELTVDDVVEAWDLDFRKKLATYCGFPYPAAANEAVQDIHLSQFRLFSSRYRKPCPQAEIIDTHQRLIDNGLLLFAMSSYLTDTLRDMEMAGLDWNSYAFVNCSDTTISPQAFESALGSLTSLIDIRSNEILYGGDTIAAGQAARNAGMQFLGVVNDRVTKAEFEKAGLSAVDSIKAFGDFALNQTALHIA
jgi:phosphoglycolate phosphatase-like HAD superfamily hydrolase